MDHENRSGRSAVTPWLLFALTAAMLGTVVYFGWDLVGSEKARADAATKGAGEAAVKLAEQEAMRRGLEERLKTLESDRASLTKSMNDLSEDLEAKEAELARLRATYDSLQDRMQAEIRKGEIRLSQSGGRIKVDLVDKVLFDSGQAELSKRGVEVLSRIAGILSEIDDKQIQVSGHTDDSPIVNDLKERYATNWELSAARAVNVVRFLSEKGKVPAKRLMAAGHGEFQPVATNINAQGRAQNRRIEILLTPLFSGAAPAAAPGKGVKPAAPTKPAKATPAKKAKPPVKTAAAGAKKR